MENTTSAMTVRVLGSRGSMPTAGESVRLFGGDTSCYCVEARGQKLYLDAGTGLNAAETSADREIDILITHCHADHILGLPMFSGVLRAGCTVRLYGKTRDGLDLAAQLERLISPPLWPVRLRDYPARVICRELALPMRLGAFEIDGMEACHPGGSTALRISACGKTLVYATDFEHTSEKLRELAALAQGADLLLYDGQYTREEYEKKPGFGHSTAEMGLEAARLSGVKSLRIIHHAPSQTDAMLLERERRLGVQFARQGEVIAL